MAKRGPNTESGRRTVSKNAWKHGITSDAVAIGNNFEDLELWVHRDGIFEHYDPVGELEFMLAERVAIGLWKMRRVDFYQMRRTLQHMAKAEFLPVTIAYPQRTLSSGELPEIPEKCSSSSGPQDNSRTCQR